MSAEYEGKMDRGTDGISKTIKILPKPLKDPSQSVRALMVTGDARGIQDASFDDGMVLQGLDPFVMHVYEQIEEAVIGRFQAVDQLWYD